MEFKKIKITPEVQQLVDSSASRIEVIISIHEGFSPHDLINEIYKITAIDKKLLTNSENFIFAAFDAGQLKKIESLDGIKKIWLNKKIITMITEALPTVSINTDSSEIIDHPIMCEDITWAVIDDGIDAGHEALIDSHVIDVDLTDEGPVGAHGTHVAGIIAGWCQTKKFRGVAPKTQLYNFKITGTKKNYGSDLAILAMEGIRKINEEAGRIVIQGANLSWGIPNNQTIKEFQPGLSPVCEEANRLVKSGVVLCVAAGNCGAQVFDVPGDNGAVDLWASVVFNSICDPGSAEYPITVGSTHKDNPDKYGISVFSSKGPAGDGRMKPDIVAPGERIRSCIPGNEYLEVTGTSQATPFVSGAVAQLFHSKPSLIGNPMKVKEILKKAARDLNRNAFFQGSGLLDISRTLQIANEDFF
jgi:hypothetical protein